MARSLGERRNEVVEPATKTRFLESRRAGWADSRRQEKETLMKGSMKLFYATLAALLSLSLATVNAGKGEPTILDYFAQLPPQTFEGTTEEMLRFIRHPGTIIDTKNGYIRCKGDGAQGDFEVALFRYSDRRPLIAVSTGSTDGESWTYLEFFAPGGDGTFRRMPNSIFPIAHAGRTENGETNGKWRFELPRVGKTIVVRNAKSGKIVRKITWDGEKFQEDK
jgi:hypothetical protein